MNKAPQFLIRYANNKMDRLNGDMESQREVTKVVYEFELGLITLDDAMERIATIGKEG